MSEVWIRWIGGRKPAGSATRSPRVLGDSGRRILARTLPLALLVMFPLATAHAETGWVKDELRLNVRTGAGTDYRILGVLKTGDQVEVLSRQDGWTQVRTGEGTEGWLPRGYLQADAPAAVMIERNASELVALREELAQNLAQRSELETTNQTLSEREVEQSRTVERLTRENVAFRSGQRWPEWITGSLILSTGMVLGWALKASANRRRSSRVRL
ncbi:TIGR04211 family SH3 domain-containing protein [Myxococcota bacterium]|nr:TIGR04211 family SH3 domain-containing protein [Myxococcota bacterium]